MARKYETSILLVTNENYLEAALALMAKARRSIDILAFSWGIGSASGRMSFDTAPYKLAARLKELKEKRGDSLRVRLYIEGLRETADRNRVTADFLERAGVEVVYGSTHAKGFSVDGRYVFFGSTNFTNQSMVKNDEANLLIDDRKVAAQFTRYFEHLWSGGGHGGLELGGPLLADGEFKDAILEMIARAKKRIEFSIYFFAHREIERALIAAHERGVKITGFIHQHFTFAMPYIRGNRATISRMRAAGLDDLHFSDGSKFSHSKYIVCDREELALGTGNWLVEDVELHPQLYVRLKDKPLAKELVAHLKEQIAAHGASLEKRAITRPRSTRS
jgi:phosphatidylserine/phosphatidylglycerophosphate/cardiolipin synthase-like enzyme